MNRSYRTIWNESLGAWVAASEISKSRGKRSKNTLAVAVLTSLLGAVPVPAYAQYTGGRIITE